MKLTQEQYKYITGETRGHAHYHFQGLPTLAELEGWVDGHIGHYNEMKKSIVTVNIEQQAKMKRLGASES